jgi:dienelactone hydrolase
MQSGTLPSIEKTVVQIRIGVDIPAALSLPENPCGLIVFGDGAGSDRQNTASRRIAELLNEGGFATALADLVTGREQVLNLRTGEVCCGLDLLEQRLVEVTDWIAMQARLRDLPIGYFGIGDGAEASLIAAAKRPDVVRAVVSCEATLDRTEPFLDAVVAPTLFIVGSEDAEFLAYQRAKIAQLPESSVRRLTVIPSTASLLHDPETVNRIALLARRWYEHYLPGLPLAH